MQLRKPLKSYPTLAGEFLEGDFKAAPVDPFAADYAQALAASDLVGVRELLARTPDVNAVRFEVGGLTVLHVACRCYQLASQGPQARRARAEAIIQILLDAGADCEATDGLHQMPAAWGSTTALRERMRQLAEAGRFPGAGFGSHGRLGSSVDTWNSGAGAGRFDPGNSYSCAFVPTGTNAFAPRGW